MNKLRMDLRWTVTGGSDLNTGRNGTWADGTQGAYLGGRRFDTSLYK